MKKIREIIQHVAPELASALGGPFAGVATKYLTDQLIGKNVSDDRDKEETLIELLNEPENLHVVKDINNKFKKEMQNLDIDVFALEISDRENARGYSKSDNKPQLKISLYFLSFYFVMLLAIFVVEASDVMNMKKGDNSLMGELQILFGVLTAGVGQILSFWFGGVLRKSKNLND